jgi:PAS domain S-box-containing protein
MDVASLVNWEYDATANLFTFNDRFYALYGTTAEREGGMQMSPQTYAREFIHPDDQYLMYREIEKFLKNTDPQYRSQVEHRIIRRDGEIRHIIVRIRVVLDAQGSLIRTYGATQDITGRKRLEEELRESKEWYSAAINNAPGPILIIKKGVIEFINDAGVRASGYSREEILNKNIISFLIPESQAVSRDAARSRAGTDKVSEYEIRFTRKDGRILNVLVRATDLPYKGETVTFALLSDITERKRTDEALKLANKKLNLLSGVTRHDILNKVSAILGYLEIAKMKNPDAAISGYLEKIQSSTNTIRSQIEFTRVYEDLGTHEPQWVNLDDVILSLHVPAPVTLHTVVKGVLVFSDPLLEKVFFNLLDNSVRHGQRVTEIRVSTHPAGEDLVVVWEDNGVGIAADEKEKIFERGFGKNTGLGMFLVRETLSLTGLSIRETGEPGHGARFEILVPKGEYRVNNG